jgi:hypothetical protein
MTLKRYNVTVNDRRSTQTVLQLSDEDAKRAGLTEKDLWTPDGKTAAKPAAKSRTSSNKARAPRNKTAAKPAAKPAEPATSVEAASDPGASEA